MDSGSGSGGASYAVGVDPKAAMQAGEYQARAAQAASAAANDQINSAIQQLSKQYQFAYQSVKPYTTTGIQALDKLNRYIGLEAYNPGTAPVAPSAADISSETIKNYIKQNTQSFYNERPTPTYVYTGAGGEGIGPGASLGGYMRAGQGINITNPDLQGTGSDTTYSDGRARVPTTGVQAYGDEAALFNNVDLQNSVRSYLAEDYLKQSMPTYQEQKDLYDFAKGQYDKYTAMGPATSQQVTDEITNQPGYQAQLGAGIDTIQKAAAAKGVLNSGGVLKALHDYGANMLSNEYGNTLSRLSALVGQGQQSAVQTGNYSVSQGQNIAQLKTSLADIQANSILSAGQARASALLAANPTYTQLGGGGGNSGWGQVGGALASVAANKIFSSKIFKEEVSQEDITEYLEKLDKVDSYKWNYIKDKETHIGPYAEDFKEAFGVGDGRTINIIDYLGIMFTTIKALRNEIKQLKEVK